MKKLFIFVFIFVSGHFLYADLNLNQLYQKASEVAVEIHGTDAKADWFKEPEIWWIHGFLLNPEGYILTCKSFIEGTKDHKIYLKDTKGYKYELDPIVVAKHPTEDAAILKVEHPNKEDFPKLSFAFKPLAVNSRVFLLVTDMDEQENYPVVGNILKVIRANNTYEAMIAIPTFTGGRGSPFFNFDGSVIGFQVASYKKHSFICITPITNIKVWIEEVIGQKL